MIKFLYFKIYGIRKKCRIKKNSICFCYIEILIEKLLSEKEKEAIRRKFM